MHSGIEATRWAIYFVFGLPFLGWLFFSRSNPLKVISALAILIFVQQSLAARQYMWAIGVGPSNITIYVALVSLLLQRRTLPNLGAGWAFWAGFLATAGAGAIVGSLGSGGLIWNTVALQEYYFEGFLFFLVGALAFTRDEELRRFLFLFLIVGLFVCIGHIFTTLTGFRFRDFNPAGDIGRDYRYGGFFSNPNTQGSFLAMTIPIGVVLLGGSVLSKLQRAIVIVSLVFMLGSLLESVHRGGILTTGLLGVLIVGLSARRPITALTTLAAGVVAAGTSYLLFTAAFPDLAHEALHLAQYKGLESPRFYFWPLYLRLVLNHPLGVGLSSGDIITASVPYGITLASTHNLYLAVLVQVGFAGLAAFLVLVFWVLSRAVRGWMVVRDPQRRQLLLAVVVPILGFLVVGMSESVWDNGYKINQLFWFWSGLSLATSVRMLKEVRRAGAQNASHAAEPGSIPDFGEIAGRSAPAATQALANVERI